MKGDESTKLKKKEHSAAYTKGGKYRRTLNYFGREGAGELKARDGKTTE